MPKPKRIVKSPEPASRIPYEEALTRRVLDALLELDMADKFRLAAVVTWIRGEWRGESKTLADVDGAVKLIEAMTERERRQAIELAAESTLRAAVTS